MALQLYKSNRLEYLAAVLAEQLQSAPPADPFATARVVVGSRGVARWLRHRLAERLGICANVAFPFPAATLDTLVKSVVGDSPGPDPWAPDALAWTVLGALEPLYEHPAFEWLLPYRADDGVVTPRQWGIARQIADVFDRYITYRPNVAVDWSEGRAVDGLPEELAWQPILWSHLASLLPQPHRAQRVTQALAAMRSGTVPSGVSGLRVFGVSSLPPTWVELLHAASTTVDVDLYLLCPSAAYWADLRRGFQAPIAWRSLSPDEVSDQLTQSMSAGNPLLAGLGRQAREFQLILESLPDDYVEASTAELFADPDAEHEGLLLHRLQSDMLGAIGPEPRPLVPQDHSVQLHSCHGATRQVEVLRDVLLAAFDADPTLHPRDVLVMTPDITAFAPIVSAVFSQGRPFRGSDHWGAAGAPSIPFEIADLSVKHRNPVADALLRVLDLVSGRVRASEVLDLLGLAPVHERFDLTSDDLPTLAEAVANTGIRWGIDAAHRATFAQPEDAQNTWSFGLERLAAGVCMADGGDIVLGSVRPYDAVEGSQTAVLGRFVHFVRTLFAELAALRAPRSAADWAAHLQTTVSTLTATQEDDAWLSLAVGEVLTDLATEAALAPEPRLASVRVMRTVLGERLDRAGAQSREHSGAVSFCAMAPMRSVPYRVVCLLGLDDGALPRANKPAAFDWTQQAPRPGDRNLRDEDRYLFLEAILAAREQLVITWTGRDVHSNEVRAPATPLSELMTVIDRTVTVPNNADGSAVSASSVLIRHHALQAHSRANFGDGCEPWSYDRGLLAGARTAAQADVPVPPFFTESGDVSQESADTLPLDELIRFLERPAETLLRGRLSLNLRDEADLLQDREPIELDILERWSVWNQIVQSRLSGTSTERLHQRLAAEGVVPLGYAGVQTTAVWTQTVDDALDALGLMDSSGTVRAASEAVRVDLNIAGTRLVGSLARRWNDTLVHVQFGGENPKRWIRPWVELLAWTASLGGSPRALVVWRTSKGPSIHGLDTPQQATEQLERLVALYNRGTAAPLRLFPSSSHAFAKALPYDPDDPDACLTDNDAVAKALATAAGSWTGFNGGDVDDPHVVKLFGTAFAGVDPQTGGAYSDFAEAALTLFGPVVAARLTSRHIKGWVPV